MRSFRLPPTLLLTSLLVAASGCRTAGVNDLARRDLFPNRAGTTAADLLAAHNRNAGRVESIEAKPWIKVGSRVTRAGLDGRLALERPRNFKLRISAGPFGTEVADIGSNDDEFWFWFKENKDKAIYFCQYDANGDSPLAAAFQPDWIVEALGLRVFPEGELAAMKVQPGRDPGTLLLSYRQKTSGGEAVVKETVLDEASHRIKEHRVLTPDRKAELARAVILEYKEYGTSAASAEGGEKVYLPSRFRLEWPEEKLGLEVGLRDVQVNTAFSQERRDLVFVEPQMPGIARVNLADRPGLAKGPTSIRDTMPAPPPRARLAEPEPIGVEGARRQPADPDALAADLPPSEARGVDEVVGPPIPTVADPLPRVVRARSGWRSSLNPNTLER